MPGAAPIKWVGELEEEVEGAPEGERFPLVLADWTAAVRGGGLGGLAAAAAAAEDDAGERALSRAAARPAGGVGSFRLGRLETATF